jgi:uncharacterized protein
MGKLLFWVVVLGAGWVVWTLIRVSQRKREQSERATRERLPERIVACEHCGVHLPASDAVRAADRWYCGPDHRDAGRR